MLTPTVTYFLQQGHANYNKVIPPSNVTPFGSHFLLNTAILNNYISNIYNILWCYILEFTTWIFRKIYFCLCSCFSVCVNVSHTCAGIPGGQRNVEKSHDSVATVGCGPPDMGFGNSIVFTWRETWILFCWAISQAHSDFLFLSLIYLNYNKLERKVIFSIIFAYKNTLREKVIRQYKFIKFSL